MKSEKIKTAWGSIWNGFKRIDFEFEGKEGTFFINADGKITLFLENEYIDGCAMILSVAETNTLNKEYEIEVALENGEIAAVLIDDTATLKRVFYYPDQNKLVLNPENPQYAPLVYVGAELDTIQILGKAVSFLGNL